MNYTEFVNAVKEKLTQELNGGVRVNVYTTKKNNATERTGLILETPGVNISPTIYLEEFFELYEKGKQMDWIIEDLVVRVHLSPYPWGISSVGRAPALQAGGHEFDSRILHLVSKETSYVP